MKISTFRGAAGYLRAMTIMVAGCMTACPAWAQNGIDAEANRILTAMSNTLKSTPVVSVDYDSDQEVVKLNGAKIQYSASGTIALDRKQGFRMTRKGAFAEAEIVFDGKTISFSDQIANVYEQLESPGPTIDDAITEVRAATELDAPGADLLSSDPYGILMDGVMEGSVVGTGFVNGVQCDHLAFRSELVDWQIWISRDKNPLPLKYVITTKWVTNAPQYTLRLSKWSTGKIDGQKFKFTPAANAQKINHLSADLTGEIISGTEH